MSASQKFYDENRERFEAETTIHDWDMTDGCPHTEIKRISSTEIRCACNAGWIGERTQLDEILESLQTTTS